MRDRGKGMEARDWWLEIARAKVSSTKGLVELGRTLAKLAKRPTPWSHTVLSKFANGESQPTQELAVAISTYYRIPQPFYVPTSLREAQAMQAIADMNAPPSKFADPVRIEREQAHLDQLAQLEREAGRQGADLQSPDEASGGSRHRRPRGVHRGG